MSFSDVFKKSFLDGFTGSDIGIRTALVALLVAGLLGFYQFTVYRGLTRKTFYSKTFNISLVGITLITTALILTIQSSIVVSLGMVGALSIVRFRTAVKDPMDLMFLFWAITDGIICGVGLAKIALLLSLILTLVIILLDRIPVARAPQILVINAGGSDTDRTILQIVEKHCRFSDVKSRNMTAESLNLVLEVRTDAGSELLKELLEKDGVKSASLLAHDGEVTF